MCRAQSSSAESDLALQNVFIVFLTPVVCQHRPDAAHGRTHRAGHPSLPTSVVEALHLSLGQQTEMWPDVYSKICRRTL